MTKDELIRDLIWACRARCEHRRRQGACGETDAACKGCRVKKYLEYEGAVLQTSALRAPFQAWASGVTALIVSTAAARGGQVWWSSVRELGEAGGLRPLKAAWWTVLPKTKEWRRLFEKTGAQRPSPRISHNGSAEQEWALK
jgi:hypothetical protein